MTWARRLIAGALLVAASPTPARACAPVWARDLQVAVASEEALIVWEPERKIEHFVRSATFRSAAGAAAGSPAPELGFLITVHFKLLYGSAFKAPSPQLLYGSPIAVGDISGNPSLKPSYVHTIEGQLVVRPSVYLVATTGLAASYVLDQAEFAQVGVNQVAQNISAVQSLSWESELHLDYRRRIATYANLSVNRTRRKLVDPGYVANLTSYPNIAYPALVAHAGASAALPRLPLRLGVEASYVSARSSSGTNTLAVGGRYALPAYLLLGGSLRTSSLEILPGRETTLAVIVRNALGADLADPGFAGVDYPRLGRTVMAEVNQQF